MVGYFSRRRVERLLGTQNSQLPTPNYQHSTVRGGANQQSPSLLLSILKKDAELVAFERWQLGVGSFQGGRKNFSNPAPEVPHNA